MEDDFHISFKDELIGYLGSIIGSISLISTTCVFMLFAFNKNLRSFTFRLVIYMQISDFLLSISIIMMAVENFLDGFSLSFCKVQAFLLNFGALATVQWSSILTFVMLSSLRTSANLLSLRYYETIYFVLGYLVPLIFTFLYFFLFDY